VEKENAVLVGDSIHDFLGARESNVDFVAAMYGFGFKNEEEKQTIRQCSHIDAPIELVEVLCLSKCNES
jgi:phosphoglycolate phosphatase